MILFCWVLLVAPADSKHKPVNVSSHAEVSNLSHSVWSRTGKQAISGSNVPEKQ